jgi:plastocyanin domain-containing protein
MHNYLVNLAGLVIILLIVWWFWLSKPGRQGDADSSER